MTAAVGEAVRHLRSPCTECLERLPHYDCASKCEKRQEFLGIISQDTRFADMAPKPLKKFTVEMCPRHPEQAQIRDHRGLATGRCELCPPEAAAPVREDPPICLKHQVRKEESRDGKFRCRECLKAAIEARWSKKAAPQAETPKAATPPPAAPPTVPVTKVPAGAAKPSAFVSNLEILLAKFPAFDPTWPPEVQIKWLEAFPKFIEVLRPGKSGGGGGGGLIDRSIDRAAPHLKLVKPPRRCAGRMGLTGFNKVWKGLG